MSSKRFTLDFELVEHVLDSDGKRLPIGRAKKKVAAARSRLRKRERILRAELEALGKELTAMNSFLEAERDGWRLVKEVD